MLVHKWSALLRVTLEAGFVSTEEREPTSSKRLLNICWRALGRDPFVRLMTIAAAHLAFEHWMMVRQGEGCANVQVALETSFWRLSWIYDRAGAPACFYVETARPVTRFATHVLGVFTFCLQSCMGGRAEIPHNLLVACCAFL